jgi:hypothetical protein
VTTRWTSCETLKNDDRVKRRQTNGFVKSSPATGGTMRAKNCRGRSDEVAAQRSRWTFYAAIYSEHVFPAKTKKELDEIWLNIYINHKDQINQNKLIFIFRVARKGIFLPILSRGKSGKEGGNR